MLNINLVAVSGLHSGPNPSPGLGVLRSLRTRPDVHLVALDYSTGSSGLHAGVADDVLVMPSWSEVHLATWTQQILSLIQDPASVLLPCLDVEVRLLDEQLGTHPRILAPSGDALSAVAKPATSAAALLSLDVPDSCTSNEYRDVARFIRMHAGGAWVKGQHYEAFRVYDARQAQTVGKFVSEQWGTPWHLEEHISGRECGLAFCARDGVLLGAVLMRKLQLTTEGKTWAGELVPLPRDLADGLSRFVSEVGWTGGGEVELLETWDGRRLLLEINPRFPAWIGGATVRGLNLPHALVHGEQLPLQRDHSRQFTRVVTEIAATSLGIPAFRWDAVGGSAIATKHPSGMPVLARRWNTELGTHRTSTVVPAVSNAWPPGILTELPSANGQPTPHRVVLPGQFDQRCDQTLSATRRLGIECAYSIKTAPSSLLLDHARSAGLLAEAISMDEYQLALDHGFEPGRCILNGPAKWWPEPERVECLAFFADSCDELERLQRRVNDGFQLSTGFVGVRINSDVCPSRFGVRLRSTDEIRRAAEAVARLGEQLGTGWGVHFHHASSVIGITEWRRAATDALRSATAIGDYLGSSPGMVDLGGGWHFDDLDIFVEQMEWIAATCETLLGSVERRVVVEPGKLLVQSSAAVVTTVIGRRDHGGDVVVDAGIADVPEAPHWQHPFAVLRNGEWCDIPPGTSRLLGKSCMEQDVLGLDLDLADLREGDQLVIGLTGGYDYSMSYPFARGKAHQL